MSLSDIQSAFSAGEISPELYGEVDLKKISSAATTMRNMFPQYRGGAVSRGGMAFVGRCKQGVAGGGTLASGSVAFALNPTIGDTVTLDGVVFTFVAPINFTTSNHTFAIGFTLASTISFAVSTLSTSATYLADAALNTVGYTETGSNTIVITAKTAGTAGNSYTLAASAGPIPQARRSPRAISPSGQIHRTAIPRHLAG